MAYTENKKASGLDTLDSSTIQNADLLIVGDVSDDSRAKAITLTNIKTFLGTYFDTLYQIALGLTSVVTGTGFTLTGGATPKTLTLSENTTLNGGTHSGTNTGDQTSIVGITGTKTQFDTACTDGNFLYVGDVTVPVKASGAELDTGTDDAKFATAKALKDSHNVPSVAPGTSGNVMTSNGTDWISSTPSGSSTTVKTILPFANGLPPTPTATNLFTPINMNTNTEMRLAQVMFPFGIVANKISCFCTGGVNTAGTLDITLYSEDGQSQIFSVTTGTISASGIVTTSLSAVSIPAGVYYLGVNTNGTADLSMYFYTSNEVDGDTSGVKSFSVISGEPTLIGTYTITAGTPPATITLSSITYASEKLLAVRLDN